jgi:hypothetical protein
VSKNTVIIEGDGPLCRQCGKPMQIREHKYISEKMKRQRYYFTRWFKCMQVECPTKEVMREEFKVKVSP